MKKSLDQDAPSAESDDIDKRKKRHPEKFDIHKRKKRRPLPGEGGLDELEGFEKAELEDDEILP